MDLTDRYLDTVRLMLPGGQRDDIIAELRDLLMSRREEREAELRRPLTRGESEDLLRDFGHPIVVAARYGRQGYLIGPELYAVYLLVLKIVIATVAVAAVVTGVVKSAVAPDQVGDAIGTAIGIVWSGGFAAVGAVTLVFASLQHTGLAGRLLTDWNVNELPRFSHRRRWRAPAWFEFAGGIVVQALFLLWWTGVLPVWWATIPVDAAGVLSFGLGPVWHALYWPVIALSLAAIVVNAVRLATPRRPRLGYALSIATHIGAAALAAAALAGGSWVVVSAVGMPAAAVAKVELGVNLGMRVALIAVIVGSIASAAHDAWRIYRPAAAQGRALSGA